jgi:hypothetical protein
MTPMGCVLPFWESKGGWFEWLTSSHSKHPCSTLLQTMSGQRVFSLILGGALTWVSARMMSRFRARTAWRLTRPESLATVVSDIGTIQTDEYERPATGIGVSRVLAIITPSLARAYSKADLEAVYIATHLPGSKLEGDLIILGGPKYNEVAKMLLTAIAAYVPVHFEGSTIEILNGGTRRTEKALIDEDRNVKEDVGLIVSLPNPFAESRGGRAILLAGSHTYGQVAAARYFVERYTGFRRQPGRGFVEIVRASVHEDHVLPPWSVYHQPIA